jgi:hypothetical protein
MASSPAARWGTGRQTSDGGLRLGSPVIDWWRWTGRGGRRRAAAAAQRRSGRGSSDDGAGRGDAQQCAAPGASMWSREDARPVTGHGGSAEGELGDGGPAAAAGARTPAIARLGLINKWLGELLGCTRKSLGACGGEGVNRREVRTGGANDGRRGSVAGARAREERPRAGFHRNWRSVRG